GGHRSTQASVGDTLVAEGSVARQLPATSTIPRPESIAPAGWLSTALQRPDTGIAACGSGASTTVRQGLAQRRRHTAGQYLIAARGLQPWSRSGGGGGEVRIVGPDLQDCLGESV